jgi:SOS response regulatory protein OraA/RecX
MSNLNYQQLTEAELREYVKHHPQDEKAFQHYLGIVRAKPNRVVVSTGEQLEAELRKRLAL